MRMTSSEPPRFCDNIRQPDIKPDYNVVCREPHFENPS